MNVATFLTRLYPPAVRQCWGDDLRREVASSGPISWPDTVLGAARLWLHPTDWPEAIKGETRRVSTIMLFTIAAATGLVLRTIPSSTTLTADVHRPVASLWLAPLVLGLLFAAPLPVLGRAALRHLAGAALRMLLAPAVAVAALFALAWSGVADHVTGVADTTVLAYYWLTLAFVVWRMCALLARVSHTLLMPSSRRLAVALLAIGTGAALAAGQNLLSVSGLDPAVVLQSATLGLLAGVALRTGHDLRVAR